MNKIVLAYSGGLDTTIAIRWLAEQYDAEIVALTVDLGASERDLQQIRERALRVGAVKAEVIDARAEFVNGYVFPALRAGAIYEGKYPLATALGRPLIAKLQVELARREGANMIAHGCTGKGNDQVRFDVTTAALAPDLKVIAPAREWGMTREQEIAWAAERDIPITVTKKSPYSIDQNLWGRSIEAGVLEDPWLEPPADVYQWTVDPEKAPDEPVYLEIGFEQGIPVALDGQTMDGVSLINRVQELAGAYGVGRIDSVENRLVGIKSREIYEAPAAIVLHRAHSALEDLTLTRDAARFKAIVAQECANLIYNGLWFSTLHQDLQAYIASSQRYVTGVVRAKLHKGNCSVVGRKAERSLYSFSLATYDEGDLFDAKASVGFIKIWGLPVRTQAQAQPPAEAPAAADVLPRVLEPEK